MSEKSESGKLGKRKKIIMKLANNKKGFKKDKNKKPLK